jgi:hypothetical protein
MATDQGRTSNVNGLAVMALLTGRTIDETGTTTYRPPFPLTVIGRRDGWCVTCVDDGWVVIDVEGSDAPSALAQGTSADLAASSPSTAVLFAGFRCPLLRTEAGFRLHVEAPWLEALLTWLDGA